MLPNARAPGEQPPRKPRILAISQAVPVRAAAVETAASRKPPPPGVAIRAHPDLGQYGMTVAGVAQVYGVAVEEIEGILRDAG